MSWARRAERTKKRLACTLVIEGSRVAGIVLDVSATGIFVQTSANPSPGTQLDVEIDIPGESERPLLAARVARRKVVPPRLKSVVHAGLGLQIESAPESFFGYLARLQAGEAAEASPSVAAPPAKPSPSVTAPPAKPSPSVTAPPAKPSPSVTAPPAKPSPAVTAPPAKPSSARGRGALRGTPPRPAAVAKKERFRVRVSQVGGSRSRSLEVSAASEEEARREAMAASGEGWKILGCERVAS